MKVLLVAVLALTHLSCLVAAWDEDRRCQRRRELKRMMLAGEIDLNDMPELDFGNHEDPELINEAGAIEGQEDSSNTRSLSGARVVMAPNNSSGRELLLEVDNGNDDSLKQMNNSSSNLLRGETEAEYAHRQLNGFDFQIKMHWEEGFCWQDEWRERKWCWQCEGSNCNEGDKIEIRVCSGSSKQRWIYKSASGGRVRFSPLTRKDLCFEMRSEKRGKLYKCDSNDADQEFTGFKKNGDEFELFPSGQSSRCLSQEHDPKSYEEIYAEECRKARGDKTSFWVVYHPSGNSGSNPSPTPQPPTPSSSGSCIYDLNLRDGGFIRDGQRLRSPDDSNLYLVQEADGNLRVTDGGREIWDSDGSGSGGDFWTQLQGKS